LVKKVEKNVALALPSGKFALKIVKVAGKVLKNWEIEVN